MRVAVVAVCVRIGCVAATAEELGPEQARAFVVGKLFSYTCFDGTAGMGRIFADGSVVGTIRPGGRGEVRFASLPPGTIRIEGSSMCAHLSGMTDAALFPGGEDRLSELSRLGLRPRFRLLRFLSAQSARRDHQPRCRNRARASPAARRRRLRRSRGAQRRSRRRRICTGVSVQSSPMVPVQEQQAHRSNSRRGCGSGKTGTDRRCSLRRRRQRCGRRLPISERWRIGE